MVDWDAVLLLDTPLLELLIRGSVTYLALLVVLRVVGRREAGGLGITDLLVVVLIAQAVAGGLSTDSISVLDGLVLVLTILFWSVAVDALAYRFPHLAVVVKARPRPLIENGEVNHRLARRELMTRDEIMTQLRLHGIEDIADVGRAYLEPNGMISVLGRERTGEDTAGPPEKPPAA